MADAIDSLTDITYAGIAKITPDGDDVSAMRVGVELKFPVVNLNGEAGSESQVKAMFRHLVSEGFDPLIEDGDNLIGATLDGEMNETTAQCETGFCKAEFSMAHCGDLHAMSKQVEHLRRTLQPFTQANDIALIGCGIHPVTPPSASLKMNRQRAGVWGQIYRSNSCIDPEAGDDVDLFTVNTANHVHVNVAQSRVASAINAMNGYAPAAIALGGNAKVWRGEVDAEHTCVAEAFWDWWKPVAGRVGMPDRVFADLDDYLAYVASLPCLYVKREAGPVAIKNPMAMKDFLRADSVEATTLDGQTVRVQPDPKDVGLHNSCYWFNARLSRYFTVENRVFDQQPPDAMLAPAAMTLGLAAACEEANDKLRAYDWDTLRAARVAAYRDGLRAETNGMALHDLAKQAVELAHIGLDKRGKNEAEFLEPFEQRLAKGQNNPADDAAAIFDCDGAAALVEARRWV